MVNKEFDIYLRPGYECSGFWANRYNRFYEDPGTLFLGLDDKAYIAKIVVGLFPHILLVQGGEHSLQKLEGNIVNSAFGKHMATPPRDLPDLYILGNMASIKAGAIENSHYRAYNNFAQTREDMYTLMSKLAVQANKATVVLIPDIAQVAKHQKFQELMGHFFMSVHEARYHNIVPILFSQSGVMRGQSDVHVIQKRNPNLPQSVSALVPRMGKANSDTSQGGVSLDFILTQETSPDTFSKIPLQTGSGEHYLSFSV